MKIRIEMIGGTFHEFDGEEAKSVQQSIKYGDDMNLRFVYLEFQNGFKMRLNLNNILFTWEETQCK